jgi:pimeloyl-ACP methyl ester carboxylesterase
MRRPVPSSRAPICAFAVLACALALASRPSFSLASSTLGFVPCAKSPAFSCSSVPVPLARSGLVPGTISLSVERKLAGPAPSRDAVVALAGGPGQEALPLGEFIAQAIAPALSSRDLLVFDQRGTGTSDPLSCSALEAFSSGTAGALFERCALQIGPARGAFTTPESVEDIEAIRQASGYEKLVLYGTSYGTKVALQYAERYPQNVEALVLDSVVPSDGPEPFAVPTFQAIAPVLDELCGNRACAAISPNPLGDLARLAAQLRRRALSGSVYDGSGRRRPSTLSEAGLLGVLQAGDLNPALRALLPAAVESALRDDPDPLLRLHLLSEGLIPNVPNDNAVEPPQEIDEALFATTSCEETRFPWQRSSSATNRLAEARAALRAQPTVDFYPFDPATAFNDSLLGACASWPDASPAPPPASALPNVPTLLLSGAQDLRTPTSNAQSVAALIPDAQVEVVPYTGHSVIGSDLSGCAAAALRAFFGGSPVQPCPASPDRFAPTPIAPRSLAFVHPPSRLGGRAGETLVAALDTLVDLNRQLIGATLQANRELPSGSSFGGLRGGYARLTASSATLKNFSFVPGVQLSGTFAVRNGQLQTSTIRISGVSASPGTVRLGSTAKQVTGRLGGRRFDVSLATVRLSRTGLGEWPARPITLAPLARLEGPGADRRGPLGRLP